VGIVHYIPLILTRNCELYESGIQLTIDGKGPYQLKAITSLFCYVHTPLFRGGTAPDLPFPNLSFPFIQFNAGPQAFSILVFLSSIITKKFAIQFCDKISYASSLAFSFYVYRRCAFFCWEKTKAFILGLITAQIVAVFPFLVV
jgi:hypothetical protein